MLMALKALRTANELAAGLHAEFVGRSDGRSNGRWWTEALVVGVTFLYYTGRS